MQVKHITFSLILIASLYSQAQVRNKMKDMNNPLLCNPESGICGIPQSNSVNKAKELATEKPVKIIYFTDPICSSCWGIEAQLRKLKLQYGSVFEIEYCMGGLLPDWSYNSGGISKPSDVASHWEEMALYYDMPMDGDVWLKDPLASSYPPSIAFKAAQIQDEEKAHRFLRELKEMVFLHKKNIATWENIAVAAKSSGLQVEQLKTDMNGAAKTAFENDLRKSREAGVRGFPTFFFLAKSGKSEIVYGSKTFEEYEKALLKVLPDALQISYPTNWDYLFSKFPSMSTREFSELSGKSKTESETLLNELANKGLIKKFTYKTGVMWQQVPTK